MQFTALSDLASSIRLQDNTRLLRQQLVRAGQELTTGRTDDMRELTKGNYNQVFAIDRVLDRIEQRRVDLADASGRAEVTQNSLDRLQSLGSNLGDPLLSAVQTGDMISARVYLREASGDLSTAASALSVRFGDRYVFSGAAEDAPPLAAPANMITDVQNIIAAAPDAATALASIDAYFQNAGGGFETGIYLGSTSDGPPVEIAEDSRLDYMMRADAPEIREMLQGLAMAAAFTDTDFGGTLSEQKTYLAATAKQITDASDSLVGLQAQLGTSEQLIADARTAAVAEKNGLEIARFDKVGVDQYEASAKFVSLQAQLDTLYNVTARLSNLRFTNYL